MSASAWPLFRCRRNQECRSGLKTNRHLHTRPDSPITRPGGEPSKILANVITFEM